MWFVLVGVGVGAGGDRAVNVNVRFAGALGGRAVNVRFAGALGGGSAAFSFAEEDRLLGGAPEGWGGISEGSRPERREGSRESWLPFSFKGWVWSWCDGGRGSGEGLVIRDAT